MIKVMLVDDQQLILDGIKLIIELEDDLNVINTALNGMEAIKLIGESVPDVLLMDIRMPIMNGVEATLKIHEKYPDIKIIILTTFDDDDYILEALANGATGYLLKNINSEKIATVIRDAYKGTLMIDGKVAQKLASHALGAAPKKLMGDAKDFTERERDIAVLLVQGYSTKDIANKLHLTQGTVKNYISNIYTVLGTSDRGKAILRLIDLGF
jgi:DNA-binding NarL/FixJ family response regulator